LCRYRKGTGKDAGTPTFDFGHIASAVDASIAWLDDGEDEAGAAAAAAVAAVAGEAAVAPVARPGGAAAGRCRLPPC
jgi:hypothetical protein